MGDGWLTEFFEREESEKDARRKPFIEKYCPKSIYRDDPSASYMNENAAIYAARDGGMTMKEIAALVVLNPSTVSKRLRDRPRAERPRIADDQELRAKSRKIGVFDVWTPKRQWEEMERERGL